MGKSFIVGLFGASLATATLVAGIVDPAAAAVASVAVQDQYGLRIDGASAGTPTTATGGGLSATGTATIVPEPLTLEIGMGMGKELYTWMKASFDLGFVSKDVGLVATDPDGKTKVRWLEDALITTVTVPKLDGSSKDAAYFQISIEPTSIQALPPTGPAPAPAPSATPWIASNFRLELGNLPCNRVATIDALTWEQPVVRTADGALAPAAASPTITPLRVTIDALDLTPWKKWHDATLAGKAGTKSGTLSLLGPDMQEELATIDFVHVGIVSLEPAAAPANADGVARFTVELYVEKMTIDVY